MKVTTEELERCEVLVTIEIEPAETQNLLKKAAKRIARQVNVPGFRRGKAPFNTIVRRFGWEVVQQEALEQSSEKVIKEALEEVEIEPYAQIELEDVSWDPLVIKIKIPVEPKVELGDYREIRLEAEPVVVTEEDVEQTLEALQEQNATWTPVERPSEIGDLISMSVTEKEGDEILTENESVEYELSAPAEEDDSQPDLTSHLLGLNAGDHKTFTVTYPDESASEQYAGKEITFEVEVSGVKVKELDPLDDEFAQQISDFDTLEALKENIRVNTRQQREQRRDSDLGYKVLKQVVESAERIEWPLVLEEEQIDQEVERYEQQLKQQAGISLDSYLQMQNKTKEELREDIRPNVVERLETGLVLSKIAELEQLEVSQSEILEQAKAISDYAGGDEQIWRNILASQAQQNMIATDLLSNKTIHRLAAIAKGEEPAPDADDVEPTPAEAPDEGETEVATVSDEEAIVEPASEVTSDEATSDVPEMATSAEEEGAESEAPEPASEVASDEATSDVPEAVAAEVEVTEEAANDTAADEETVATES